MNTKWTLAVVCLAMAGVASATPITVVNGDFSEPIAKQTLGYDVIGGDVLGWSNTGATYTDSGVEAAPGAEVAFQRGDNDGAYQILNYAMVAGEQYTLTWDSQLLWQGEEETVTLLSATTTGDAFGSTDTLNSYVGAAAIGQSLVYTATATDAGKYLGISFDNTSATGDSWVDWDNFAVDAVPEPATLGMVAVFGGAVLFIRRKLQM